MNYINNNNFFILNDYYIYLYDNNIEYIYKCEIIDEILYIFIFNKYINNDINIKIIYNNNYFIKRYENNNNIIKINDLSTLKYIESNEYSDIINIYPNVFKNFNIDYYIENNKLLELYNKNILNNNFIYNHWYYTGRYYPNVYFKYILKKYEEYIFKIKYPNIIYSNNKIKTLLFIDDRYDSSFIYLLILFLYSIDLSWNITIFTTIDNKDKYENDLKKISVEGKIIILENKFNNITDYSNLLKNPIFWNKIKEDYCLLFQYDSYCMGKFDDIFFNYNYIGARWNHKPSIFKNLTIGNGGTSFRKTRIMEYLCNKYKNKDIKKNYPEDIFFSELLYEEKLNYCSEDISNYFSFENIYYENSIYAHQIYKVINFNQLDKFMLYHITNMIE